ncbi:hypothetical protein HUU61_04010 [Rhodopseudomonas palustris]|nr:hypothetical protein [Rhodopseudomonas palustris]
MVITSREEALMRSATSPGNASLAAMVRAQSSSWEALIQRIISPAPNLSRYAANWSLNKVPSLAAFLNDAETDVLAYISFPPAHRTKLNSTNPRSSIPTARSQRGRHHPAGRDHGKRVSRRTADRAEIRAAGVGRQVTSVDLPG